MIERTDKSRFTFTQIDNRLLQNKELSLQAKGLLCYMLSNVDNWQFTIHSLMVFTGATRAQVRSALLELEEHHYISKERHYVNGRFKCYIYTVREYHGDGEEYVYYV